MEFELSVKTSTGKEFGVDHCVATNYSMQGSLYIEFIGYSMTEIFNVFTNKEETKVIYGYVGGELNKTFNDYTIFAEIFIVPDAEGHVRIRLDMEQELVILGQ